MSQLPKNKNLPDIEQIAQVEECGVFTGQSGKYWTHPGRSQKTLTPEELEKFDVKLGELLPLLTEDDLLLITADHGNDPTHTGTDHTREQVPFLAYSPAMTGCGKLPDAETFAVIGATIAENFGVTMPEGTIGTSVLQQLC